MSELINDPDYDDVDDDEPTFTPKGLSDGEIYANASMADAVNRARDKTPEEVAETCRPVQTAYSWGNEAESPVQRADRLAYEDAYRQQENRRLALEAAMKVSGALWVSTGTVNSVESLMATAKTMADFLNGPAPEEV